ncbi:uncharacterized protein DNG_03969 [Cephalotrichum gorgonifer]|uniref:Glucose-methanol-choline oxidoreductase N-terminal domain-containing protein n=1 Tax=Cephalotrichum gorgonifer TaxID=2041049 RepID=A0AAE8MVP5_9PEZI|nr:uncharacterized protein DNG_03969 [Cephalotrichum gorgonifer]
MSPTYAIGLRGLLAASLLGVAVARPSHARGALVKRQDELLDEYDFIVVGAGTAGLTVADRLSEEGKFTVLCIEYGYLDSSTAITTVGPGPRENTLPSGSRYYNITSVPQPGLADQPKAAMAGAVVGGSSAVNGMFFDRGSAEDYDSWVSSAGEWSADFADEWGWENILPYFKKSVTFHPPSAEVADEYGITYDVEGAYGGVTPIHSSYAPYQWSVSKYIWDGFKTVEGVEFPVEGADGHAVGVFWCPNSIDPSTRTRSYSKIGHYDTEGGPAYRQNFHLLTGHRVTQVTLEEAEDGVWDATGVLFTPRDGNMPKKGAWKVKARKEVIVSAGALHSPQVLERSGIGAADILEAANVSVKVKLPGVGSNFQDHPNYPISFRWQKDVGPTPENMNSNEEFMAQAQELWAANKTGPLAAYVNTAAFLPLSVLTPDYASIVDEILAQKPEDLLPEGLDPTIYAGYGEHLKVLAALYNSTGAAVLEVPFSGRSTFSIVNLKELSRGSVHISPEDDGIDEFGRGNVEPVVDYRALSNPIDNRINAIFVSFMRQFLSSEAMVEALDPVEVSPGLEEYPDGSEELDGWLRRVLNPSTGHPVGTCSLGPIELAGVVGPDLTVYGTRKLSVADNSIMPVIPGTHTSSTAYAIGEKAADLVKRRAGWSEAGEGAPEADKPTVEAPEVEVPEEVPAVEIEVPEEGSEAKIEVPKDAPEVDLEIPAQP